ncbi:hypothetical protein C0Q70_08504 [Pomacea canaliculata]|uniref:K Homology domain-containing protein n=1 Tax=Pomacea canaliculata TaxID=400727 RepID=A0A2T7PI00_POMCA|nr:hypothetical protein C0Q70_08504 [Pomacea canaliculata]
MADLGPSPLSSTPLRRTSSKSRRRGRRASVQEAKHREEKKEVADYHYFLSDHVCGPVRDANTLLSIQQETGAEVRLADIPSSVQDTTCFLIRGSRAEIEAAVQTMCKKTGLQSRCQAPCLRWCGGCGTGGMEGWQGDGNPTCWESCGAGGNGVWLGRCPTTGRPCPGYGDVQLLGAAPELGKWRLVTGQPYILAGGYRLRSGQLCTDLEARDSGIQTQGVTRRVTGRLYTG